MAPDIPFNKPFVTGKEIEYLEEAVRHGSFAGDGPFTERCRRLLEERFAIRRLLLTPSCTAALEMAATLLDVGPGDEVVLPSFTYVSTANAFVRRGARPVFVDVRADTLNIDEDLIEAAISPRTKMICAVHYAAVAAEMDAILAVAARHGVPVVEDAALAVNAFYRDRPLGTIGHLGAFSFHETKNFTCGEGGALCVNDPQHAGRAENIREKGTNRPSFQRGEVDRYEWVDVGSSYLPTELASAFLLAQLEQIDEITERRRRIFEYYDAALEPLEQQGLCRRPIVPPECRSNYHAYHVLLPDERTRDALIGHLRTRGIAAAFHYLPLHTSPMGRTVGSCPAPLPVTEDAARRLVRLPFFTELTEAQQQRTVEAIAGFLGAGRTA